MKKEWTCNGRKRVCAECGKEFTIFTFLKGYIFKKESCKKMYYFCSCSCYERWLKKYGER